MKRIWIGIGILVALLIVSFWAMGVMDRIHSDISRNLEKASDAPWNKALSLTHQAQKDWMESRRFSAALADHAAIDDIDSLFAQLAVYEKEKDKTHYAATCAELSEMVRALEEGHQLSWWNIL